MTREKIQEAAEVMLAFTEGKAIQYRRRDSNDRWLNWINDCAPSFDWLVMEYRIKPEPKYRPFKTQEECWNEMHKHPDFGWVKSESALVSIIRIDYQLNEDLYFTINGTGGNCAIHTDLMFEGYTFTDGTPFGINEE